MAKRILIEKYDSMRTTREDLSINNIKNKGVKI